MFRVPGTRRPGAKNNQPDLDVIVNHVTAEANMAGSEDESEWEYEYDQTSTQDFYLTLDLTTHIPPALARDKRAKAGPKPTVRASNKSLANAPGAATHLYPTNDAAQNDKDADNARSGGPERMQIVGLHHKKPIVSYNNAIYSCHWATDLATQIFLAPPPDRIDADHPALRSTPSFDVLGTACARIVAVPATIQPRETAQPKPITASPFLGPDTSYTTAEGDIIQHTTTKGLRIELPTTASAQRVSQAKFLESLSAIKARRGDSDAVPVTNIKVYHPPEGWEEERDEWIAKESARSKKDKAEAAARISRQNRRAAYVRPDPDEQAEQGSEDEEDADKDAEDDEDGEPTLASLKARKKRTMRGGNRGGAPSGKRLRQSLGLPEARRDKRPRGRPRKKRNTVATESPAAEDAAEDAFAGPSQVAADIQVEQTDTIMTEGAVQEDAE